MSIQQNFPAISPSLSLNFARSKTLDPRITFSRTSTATRVNEQGLVEVVSADIPRFDHKYDASTGVIKSLGLLVEEQRTNSWLNSESQVSLSRISSAATDNYTISPAGTQTAVRIEFSGTTTTWDIVYQGVFTGTYVWSAWLKTEDGSSKTVYVTWGPPDAAKRVTLNIDGEWKRYSAVVTPSNQNVHLGNHNTITPAGWSAFNIHMWGVQLEAGAFATSYIPTSGGTATRNPDNVSMEGDNFSDWYNQSEGSIFMQSSLLDVGNTGGKLLWSINQDGVFGEGFYMVNENNQTSITINAFYGGSNQAQFSGPTGITTNQYHKIIFSYQENNVNACFDGTLGITDTSVGIATVDRLVIGNNAWGNILNPGDCHISQFTYYPRRLTDAQLQNLTK